MSNQNENLEPKQNSEHIEINENGELVINNPELKEAIGELTPEELEDVAGGAVTINVYQCGKAK